MGVRGIAIGLDLNPGRGLRGKIQGPMRMFLQARDRAHHVDIVTLLQKVRGGDDLVARLASNTGDETGRSAEG